MTEYFQHDFNCRNHPKIVALLDDHGAAGYGIFWAVIEFTHEIYPEPICKEFQYKAIAKQVGASAEQVKAIIQDCCNKYDLLTENQDGGVTSKRTIENMERREQLSAKRSESGRKGAEAKAIAKQMPANAKQNQAKEIKEKEIKEKEIKENTNTVFCEKNEFSKEKEEIPETWQALERIKAIFPNRESLHLAERIWAETVESQEMAAEIEKKAGDYADYVRISGQKPFKLGKWLSGREWENDYIELSKAAQSLSELRNGGKNGQSGGSPGWDSAKMLEFLKKKGPGDSVEQK